MSGKGMSDLCGLAVKFRTRDSAFFRVFPRSNVVSIREKVSESEGSDETSWRF